MMKPASGGAAGGGDDGQSGPTKSLRFDDGSSSKLTFTPASVGTGTTQTIAFWLKVGSKSAYDVVFSAFNGSSNQDAIYFDTGDNKLIVQLDGIGTVLKTSQEFRDPTGWMHFCVTLDSTEDASSDRMKLYVNGSEVTAFDTDSRSSFVQDSSPAGFNEARVHTIGGSSHSAGDWFDGYVYDFYFIDGTALAPVGNFIEADSTSGVYKPKVYDLSGDGSNSFHLKFEDDSDIGLDSSDNGSDFTATNLGSHDCVLDRPTNNFATLNELTNSASALSEGSLKWPADTFPRNCQGTFGMSSGKWYFESRHTGGGSSNRLQAGIATSGVNGSTYPLSSIPSGHYWHSIDSIGDFWNNTTNTSNSTAWIAGDVIGVAIDLDSATNTVTYTKNGTTVGSAQDLESGQTWFAHVTSASGTATPSILNFGQDSTFAGEETAGGESDDNGYGDFAYTVPSGYLALCSANLSATITDPSKHFGAITWTGNGTNNNDAQAITGLGFQPDLVWVKGLSGTRHHELHDSVRGAGKRVFSSDSAAESDKSTLDSFDSDGFTVSIGTSGQDGTNANGTDFVGWCWKAGTAFDPSTGGSGSGGSKNASAGFSIVTWSGQDDDMENGSDTDVYHGLGVKPDLILIKNRTNYSDSDTGSDINWCLWNSGLSGDDYFKRLNTSDDEQQWDSGSEGLKSIGTSTFTVANGQYDTGTSFFLNYNDLSAMGSGEADDYVAYCFANSDVFQTGVYSGNSSTDGPVINTGFKPAMVWLDRIGSQSLHMMDTARSPSNVVDDQLYPNSNSAEAADNLVKIDILSNGFKLRNSQTATNGTSSTKYLYYAFAEEHAKYSTAF